MASTACQLLGLFLGLLGFVGTVVATVLPHWHCPAHDGFNGFNIIGYMKGLWVKCVWRSTGISQCELYSSVLGLPSDLQAGRALMLFSCITSILASVVSVMGMKCTRFARGSLIKSPLVLSGAISFFCSGILCLVTVSWTTYNVNTDFYDFIVPSLLKYEIGLAVYLGYASGCLSLTGGLVLCCSSGSDRSRSPLYMQRNQQSSPPPAFNNIYPPAPPYSPPNALMDNHAPSLFSPASGGYGLDNYI